MLPRTPAGSATGTRAASAPMTTCPRQMLDRAERMRRGLRILGCVQAYVTRHEAYSTDQPQAWEQLLQARAELNALIELERQEGGEAWTAFVARRPANTS